MLKAIETVYHDCRFRSRLEARYAVLMDALDVKWEYEKEGYRLDGAWYLPDFWLPELHLFLEIKPDDVNGQGYVKPRALAVQGKVNVIVMCGTMSDDPAPDLGIDVAYEQSTGRLYVGDHHGFSKERGYWIWYCLTHAEVPPGLVTFIHDKEAQGHKLGPRVDYDGSEDSWRDIVAQDCIYYRQKYGREHPSYECGIPFFDGLSWYHQNGCGYLFGGPECWHSDPVLHSAYEAARSARFDHREIPGGDKWTPYRLH